VIPALLLAIDLHLQSPHSTAGIEGNWTYAPLDGSPSYKIQIHATPGGFYEFAGNREGQSGPVLQFDRAEEGNGTGFRGEVEAGFDPCVSAGARFRLYPGADSLVFEPSLPMSSSYAPPPPGGPCAGGQHYFLTAKGRGDEVRLKPAEELAGYAGGAGDPGKAASGGAAHGDKAAATVALGVPTAPDGAQVEVLGSMRDAKNKLWHHVRVDKKTGYVPAETVQVRWECRLQR